MLVKKDRKIVRIRGKLYIFRKGVKCKNCILERISKCNAILVPKENSTLTSIRDICKEYPDYIIIDGGIW